MAVYKDQNKTSDGRSWYYITYKKDFNGVNKKYKSKRYMTKSEAQQAERLFLMKRDNPINKSFVLVASAYFEELYSIRKEATPYCYEALYNKHIKPYFNDFNINEINISIIDQWKLEMAKKSLKLSYLNNIYSILKSIFDFAIKKYGLSSNPVAISGRFQKKNEDVIKNEEKLRYITYDEFNQLISVIDNITWKTFFMFLYYTGMRKGEVQALNWNDIDFENSSIIVNKTLSTKTKKDFKITSTKNNLNRTVKMNKTLKEQLQIYKSEMMKYIDFKNSWFVFGNTRFMPETTIARYKHKYFKLAKINEYIKANQTDTVKLFLMMSNRLGHTIEVMQRTYMHLFPTIQTEIVDILDNL